MNTCWVVVKIVNTPTEAVTLIDTASSYITINSIYDAKFFHKK